MTGGNLQAKRNTSQVADVHRPLLSISGCADMGFDCFLGQNGCQLRDRVSGEVIPLERHGSLYTVRMWVRQEPNARPDQRFGGQGYRRRIAFPQDPEDLFIQLEMACQGSRVRQGWRRQRATGQEGKEEMSTRRTMPET